MMEEDDILIERTGKKQLHFLFHMKDGRGYDMDCRNGAFSWFVAPSRLIFV